MGPTIVYIDFGRVGNKKVVGLTILSCICALSAQLATHTLSETSLLSVQVIQILEGIPRDASLGALSSHYLLSANALTAQNPPTSSYFYLFIFFTFIFVFLMPVSSFLFIHPLFTSQIFLSSHSDPLSAS